jgi:hypothetical protein
MAGEAPGYTITVEADRIVVQHTGAVSLDEIKASRREFAALATERKLSLVIIDLSHADSCSLTMLDIFDLCESHPSVLTLWLAVAVVYRPDQVPAEDVRFAETASQNRGVKLGMFVDLEAAHRWLSNVFRRLTLQ